MIIFRACATLLASLIALSCSRVTSEKDTKIMTDITIGKTVAELYKSKTAINQKCFIGASPPSIYSKGGNNFLDGILPQECSSFLSFEMSLVEREKNRPPKSSNNELLQTLNFNANSEIASKEIFTLSLIKIDAEMQNKILETAINLPIQRFKSVEKNVVTISEDQCATKETTDYYLVLTENKGIPSIFRISKKYLGSESWIYETGGKLIDVKVNPAN
jgi:hypothetical protein